MAAERGNHPCKTNKCQAEQPKLADTRALNLCARSCLLVTGTLNLAAFNELAR
jgi:hypothetical protein